MWLRQSYNIEKYGPPTWRKLVEAVGSPTGGNNRALAKGIASRHPWRPEEPPLVLPDAKPIMPDDTTNHNNLLDLVREKNDHISSLQQKLQALQEQIRTIKERVTMQVNLHDES